MSVKAKKHLGQHFLKDESIAKRIVDSLTWNAYENVLEIGPGMGVLTKFLMQENKAVSVGEIDTESVAYFHQNYPELPVYAEDCLKMNLGEKFNYEPSSIICSFPYNIASKSDI